MQTQYNTLIQNGTLTLTNLPYGETLVGCKWVFQKKYNANNTLQ